MRRQSRIGHNQHQILVVLFDYNKRYPEQWVPHYRLIEDLTMNEATFNRALQGLVDPNNHTSDCNPLVEMTHPSIAYREFQGDIIPLPDNATMSDALIAMKFAWEGNTARHNFYRITDFGVERLVRATKNTPLTSTKKRAKPASNPYNSLRKTS